MTRYFLEIMYNGTAFHGSQLQGELPTVQLAINNTLSILLKTKIESFGASRTDEGVHALANYYHFDTDQALPGDFPYKMNAILPPTISVNKVYKAKNMEINARFDAIARRYRYRIYTTKNPFLHERALFYPFKIDKEILNKTAQLIKEHTDFESFSKRNTQSYTFNCRIFQSFWEQQGAELHYVVEANRFLRGMVRGLVGTQLKAARGKISVEEFNAIIEAKDCTKAYFNVAGHGLYLEHISYPENALQILQFK